MRRIAACVALAGSLILAQPASADDDPPMCPWGMGDWWNYAATLGPMVEPPAIPVSVSTGLPIADPVYPRGGGFDAAREALGPQITALWFDSRWQGWGVAFAPGPLDLTAARAAIVGELHERFDAELAAFVGGALRLFPALYSERELKAVADAIFPLIRGSGIAAEWRIGCVTSDHPRVEFTRWVGDREPTPQEVAETQALLAPFGDMVRIRFERGFGPQNLAGIVAEPPFAGEYVSLPRASRCVRGKRIGLKAAKDSALRSVTITAGKRHATALPGRRTSLRLTARATKVTVTVNLRDGRTATLTKTYRRC